MTPRGLEERGGHGNTGDCSEPTGTSHASEGPENAGVRRIGVQDVTLSRVREQIAWLDALRVELEVQGDDRGAATARKLLSHLRSKAATRDR